MHFTIDAQQYLNHQLPYTWIRRGSRIRWTPHSPDLILLNFIMWDHLKNVIYKTPKKDLTELRRRINNEINLISKETLRNVFMNIAKRMHLYIESDGKHFEYLL